jgi:hypothetical protein
MLRAHPRLERHAPKLEISSPPYVRSGAAFVVTVVVGGAPQGRPVTVTLEQKRGPKPLAPAQSVECPTGEDGAAFAAFKVVLSGREGGSSAVLVATARDQKGRLICADGASIDIV